MKNYAILFITNNISSFVSHRLPIGLRLIELGYEVHLAAAMNCLESAEIINNSGIKFYPLKLSRSGINIFSEAKSFFEILRLIKGLNPHLVHLVTIKPVIYGGIAARMLRTNGLVVAISGLGYLFMAKNIFFKFMRFIVAQIFKFIFSKKDIFVIFQNSADQQFLMKLSNLNADKAVLIRGSGVNLEEFKSKIAPSKLPYVVTMASRLLKDKGVLEYIEASKILLKRGENIEFRLVGDIDCGNPSSLSLHDLSQINEMGCIKVYGYCNNISEMYNESRIIVLPSYREGLPKALIEAAACGRPVITTDVPGCRDAIDPGYTGRLIPPYDPLALANSIEQLIFDDNLCDSMGLLARQFAEREFSIKKVINQHLNIYKLLLNGALTR
jgi:glycosyltransferase involved in cell wall biosynthesis